MNAENAAMTPAAENAVVETATESIGTRFTKKVLAQFASCLLYTSPSPRDA